MEVTAALALDVAALQVDRFQVQGMRATSHTELCAGIRLPAW
jgi:hypothetical protein